MAVDRYEYAAQETSVVDGKSSVFDTWTSRRIAQDRVERWREYEEENVREGLDFQFTYKLVRRRKVGPVEDVPEGE